jgi:hypothetical protein
LDVKWDAQLGDEFFAGTLQLICEKAPFFRWRTLELFMLNNNWYAGTPWSSADAFTNLESLYIFDGTDNTILGVIDHTVTSRLKVLNLGSWPEASQANIMPSFARSFAYISSFCLKSLYWNQNVLFLPANVVNLQLEQGHQHPFPNIQTYKLEECIFVQGNGLDLQNMTTLIVSGRLKIDSNCQVFLPAL